MPIRDLAPDDAHAQLQTEADLRILDVRTPHEHAMHHLEGAELVPIQEIEARFSELDSEAKWLVVCEHGVRSQAACHFLDAMGFGDVRNVSGGMARWIGEGLPLAPERPAS